MFREGRKWWRGEDKKREGGREGGRGFPRGIHHRLILCFSFSAIGAASVYSQGQKIALKCVSSLFCEEPLSGFLHLLP